MGDSDPAAPETQEEAAPAPAPSPAPAPAPSPAPSPAAPAPPSQLHHVSKATYPIPEPLVQRLKAGVLLPETDATAIAPTPTPTPLLAADTANADATDSPPLPQPHRQVDPLQEALTSLVGNSIEAMDAMYFATAARLRKHASFQHRFCLRVRADANAKTLSITDVRIYSKMRRSHIDIFTTVTIHCNYSSLSSANYPTSKLKTYDLTNISLVPSYCTARDWYDAR